MERLTEKIKDRRTGEVLATRILCGKIEAYDKLAEYEDAEEQGLLIKLQVKVNSTVYLIDHNICDTRKKTA